MKATDINNEIKEVKNTMDLLMACVQDKNISASERNTYYKDYLEAPKFYLILNRSKPSHNLTIA